MIGDGAILACSAARWHPQIAAACANMCYTPRHRTNWCFWPTDSKSACFYGGSREGYYGGDALLQRGTQCAGVLRGGPKPVRKRARRLPARTHLLRQCVDGWNARHLAQDRGRRSVRQNYCQQAQLRAFEEYL